MKERIEEKVVQGAGRASPDRTVKIGWLFLAVVVLVVVYRSFWTFPIGHGDAIQKWRWAQLIATSGDWGLMTTNHHSSRWSAIIPQVLLYRVFGGRYELFFALPLLIFALYWTTLLFYMRRLLPRAPLILLGAWLLIDRTGIFVSNELLITGLGILGALWGCHLMASHVDDRARWAVVMALPFFLAYGAHITYLSFAAGAIAYLLFYRRDGRKAIIFAVTIALLILAETWVFNRLSGGELGAGRFEILAKGAHAERMAGSEQAVYFRQLFGRWLELPKLNVLLCMGFACFGFWQLFTGKYRNLPAGIAILYFVGLAFALGVSFAVTSIDPIRPVMPLLKRYLFPFMPFAAAISFWMMAEWLSGRDKPDRIMASGGPALVLAILMLSTPVLTVEFYRNRFVGFIWNAQEQYSGFSDRLSRGELVLVGNRRVAFARLAQFVQPIEIVNRKGMVYAAPLAEGYRCIEALGRLPLSSNEYACRPAAERALK